MSRALKDAIAQLAGTFNEDFVNIIACTVNSCQPDSRQCTCTPLNGKGEAAITVNLSAEPNDGLLITPTINSTVLVAQTKQNDPFVLMFSDIDGFSIITSDGKTQFVIGTAGSIQMNDGSYGGLTKTQELQAQLDKTNAVVKAILDTITGTVINEPGNGNPSAFQHALNLAVTLPQPLNVGDFSTIENT